MKEETILGAGDGVESELIALYDAQAPVTNDNSPVTKTQVLGKLSVVTYDEIVKDLVIVPVNGNKYPYREDSLRTKLNKIYGQAVVKWNITFAQNFDVPGIDPFDDGGSGLLSNYSPDMRKVVNAYKANLQPNTYYLFLVKNPKSTTLAGFMPRSKECGFIFVDKNGSEEELARTIAHELGHGAFQLRHTFADERNTLPKGTTTNLMDYVPAGQAGADGTKLYKYQWDRVRYREIVIGLFEDDEEGAMMAGDPYFKQRITRPNGKTDNTHEDAVLIQDEKDQTIAFILPDEKVFFWVDEGQWEGYFENGLKEPKGTYLSYVEDKYMRRDQPISWGIYLAARDLGGFAIDLVETPVETSKNLATGLYKIATLQFDIEKTWERVINADKTDGAYVVATLAMGYLAGPKGKAVVAAEDAPRFGEMVGEYASKLRPVKLTWPQLLALFKKARQFEALITTHLKTLYPIEQGFTVLKQVYLKVDGVMSIADNIIYNSKTGQFILNETKYGATNLLRKNQQIIQDAIKAGKEIEIRSVQGIRDNAGTLVKAQGQTIKVTKIIRSNSIDGTISTNTITTIWP